MAAVTVAVAVAESVAAVTIGTVKPALVAVAGILLNGVGTLQEATSASQ